MTGTGQERVHYITVRKAGSGVLQSHVDWSLGRGEDEGLPLLVAMAMNGWFFCPDEPMSVEAGLINAMVNPGKALDMAWSHQRLNGAKSEVDTFNVLQQWQVMLFLAERQLDRISEIQGAHNDIVAARAILVDLQDWSHRRLSQLSGENPLTPLDVPKKVMNQCAKLAHRGVRLAAWRRTHEVYLRAGASAAKSAEPKRRGARRGRKPVSTPERDEKIVREYKASGLTKAAFEEGRSDLAPRDVERAQARIRRRGRREQLSRKGAD